MYKTTRKIVALTLTLAMMISSVGFSYAETGGDSIKSSTFIDMPSNWAAASLENAVKNGLISGYDTVKGKEIRANGNLTRAEMAAIINRAFGASEQGNISSFSDVSGSQWYAPEMAKAVTMGTFTGNNGKMRPNASITREEAFAVLARAFKIELKKNSELSAFSDANNVSSWAIPEVAGLASKGYIAGSNGKLNPKASITRAEFAKIMDNMVKQYIVTAGDYSSTETGTVVVNVPGVTLSNLTITGDLIIADGVGAGEVHLDGVTVKGNTVVRGGGANSIDVTGNSSLGQVIISKTASGDISIKVTGDAKVENVSIVDGKVYLSGKISRLDVMGDVPVSLVGANIDTVNVEAKGATVSLDSTSKVNALQVESTATGTELTVAKGATITSAMLNASASIKNDGTIKTLESNATGVKLSGNAPATVTGTNPPTNETSSTSGNNGGGHNGSSVKVDDNPLKVSRTGYELQNYTASFKPENTNGIKNNVLFYSTVGAVDISKEYGKPNDTETANLAAQGKVLSIGTGSSISVNLPATLSAINGHMFNQNEKYSFYYIYVASVPTDASEDIMFTKADLMIHPERGPAALTSIGDGPGKGATVPAGGATSMSKKSTYFVQAYIDNMKQNTPGITPKIADFSASWQLTEELLYDDFYNNGDKEAFESNGLEPVYIPLALDNYESVANEQYFADLVESCQISFFFGGAQLRHTRTLLNDDGTLSKVGQAIQNVLARGGTVAGSSAGSAVMSGYSYTDGANYSYQPMYWNKSELVNFSNYNGETDKEPVASHNGNSLYYKSIGVIEPSAGRDALMDSHFDIRGRLGRLLVALRDTDRTGLAIGPDEGTGIRIREHVGTVFGLGGVYIVDAANAVWGSGTGTSHPLSVTGIKLNYLTEGDTYNFDTGVVTPKSGKTAVTSPTGTVYKTNDAFGAYETSKTILSLADSAATSVTVKGKKAPDSAYANGPTFDITYTKVADTKAYNSSGDMYDKGEIKDYLITKEKTFYKKTTIINLNMDVVPGHDLPVVKKITSTATGASIAFNNPLCLGTTTSGSVYLIGKDTENYLVIKDSGKNAKKIVTGDAFSINGNVLNIELAAGIFEKGDTIQFTTNVKDIYGESVNKDITYWFSGTKWSSPLKVTKVYPSSSKTYRTFIEFSNEIAIGYTDAADDNYYIDPTSSPEVKAQYIVVKDDEGNVKALDSANSFWLDPEYPKEIMIDLDTENFETGDTITITTEIKDIYGEGIVEDVTYEYSYDTVAKEGEWTLAVQ